MKNLNKIYGIVFLIYFAVYFVYLWFSRENEFFHWITLVLVPLVAVMIIKKIKEKSWNTRETLAECGFVRDNLKNGILLGVGVGILGSFLQLFISDSRVRFWEMLANGQIWIALPLALLFLLMTAGFTEEFFFRGILQSRLANWWRSEKFALAVSSALFGIYHLPYRYLGSNSLMAGDLRLSLLECLWCGLAGLVLGFVFCKSKRNLLAVILCHTLIDLLPAASMFHFSN